MKLTAQMIFDECARHVINQGEPAMNGSTCKYLSDKGTSCAIGGPLRAAGLYAPEMDRFNASVAGLLNGDAGSEPRKVPGYVMLKAALKAWGVQDADLPLVSDIQGAHDCAEHSMGQDVFLGDFKERMRRAAVKFGLSTYVLDGQQTAA